MPAPDFYSAVDRYGLPLAFLGIILLIFFKVWWPYYVSQMKEAQARLDNATQVFMGQLDKRDREFSKMVASVDQLRISQERLVQEMVRVFTTKNSRKAAQNLSKVQT